jgi:Fe-S-cluster-containing dehydrogenase component/anaerobic selenocysteine-containing dehydrogenase
LDLHADQENQSHLPSISNPQTSMEPDEAKAPIEVFVNLEEPFERPAEEFIPGPFYRNVEERVPEVDERRVGSPKQDGSLSIDRRDFMRLFSASTLVSAAACVRRPEEKAVPFVNQAVDHVVSEPDHYASTCGECHAACGVIVKTNGGRPTKIEGHAAHPISRGATCALGQSTLQSLYHPERRQKPLMRVSNRDDLAEWDEVFERLGARVGKAKNVAIWTGASTGHRRGFFKYFLEHIGHKGSNVYTYDANPLLSSQSKAHEIAFGAAGMPRVDLVAAKTIVGIGSDFLDVGISPVHYSKEYSASHSYRLGQMGLFVQFESILTNTGARAHDRYVIPAGSELIVALLLVRALLNHSASKGSASERAQISQALEANRSAMDAAVNDLGVTAQDFDKVAGQLLADRSVVLCGSTASGDFETSLQLAGIMANLLIGAYGSTLHLDRAWHQSPVNSGDLERFITDAAQIDLLIVVDSNPVFSVPAAFGLAEVLKKIPTVVSIQSQNTETDNLAQFVLPGRHYLESWGDEQPIAGFWSIRQPTIRPTTDSRQAEDVLLWLAAAMTKPTAYREYREYLRERWQVVHKTAQSDKDFETFWGEALRRGFHVNLQKRTVRPFSLASSALKTKARVQGMVLVSPLDKRMLDGRGADRPILQEVGDSLSTVTWDNWVAIHPKTAKAMGLKRNDLLKVETEYGSVEAALYPMPGMHRDAVAIYRGHGRAKGVNKVTDGFGVDPSPLFAKAIDAECGAPVTSGISVKISSTAKTHALAAMQKHNDIANRQDIMKKMTVADVNARSGKFKDLDTVPDLYPKLKASPDYRWGMAIDLTSCTGCSACMVACSIENNIPQIGRDQVRKGREMHWIRLDRYFAGPVDNPEVTFQPVMCQHCNHAPCEGVCPVYATIHDPEGQNAQVYNRCVGTRYCANACPYKVRRFNWFTHKWNIVTQSETDRNLRALNPDVTVRTRGIMEKCSFCVQRLQKAKHYAKERGAKVRDGEVRTACQQVCPTDAIQFGNLLDEGSIVSRMRKDPRAFLMLNGDPEHHHYGIKTMPNVSYLAEVTHKPSAINQGHHESKKAEPAADHGSEHG